VLVSYGRCLILVCNGEEIVVIMLARGVSMCLLFVAYKMSPAFRIILAANRDEFLARPAEPLGVIDGCNNPGILAGKDLQAGGTWLGLSAGHRFGALTNYRDPSISKTNAPSRGNIILDFLEGKSKPEDFLALLSLQGHKYGGFNLIIGDRDELYYYSNRDGEIVELQTGFYGLSNGLLDQPWPKVERGKKLLRPYMVGVQEIDQQAIFSCLRDSWQPDDHLLPSTGVSIVWERLLGPVFIDGVDYGTRSSAIITISRSGMATFTEKTYHRSETGGITSSLVEKGLWQ
jgi:uncharacterized protein with NRDE domain